MTLLSTAGISWNLHKRWREKYLNAKNRAMHGPGTWRKRGHWARVSHRILTKYPFVQYPLRYAVNFERVLMPKIHSGGTEDIREILSNEENSLMRAAGVPKAMLVFREPTAEEVAARACEDAWKHRSKAHPGIPGKSVRISVMEYIDGFSDPEILSALRENLAAVLYYYNDIRFLSGTAGFVVMLEGKCLARQVTTMS